MFGIEREFRCKKCRRLQNQQISFTKLYRINNSDIEYVDLNCEECGELHYVASDGIILEEITEEAKEKKAEESEYHKLFKGYKERFLKEAKFILIEDAVIHHSDAKSVVDIGMAAF